MTKRMNAPARKKIRREQAEERQAIHNALPLEEKFKKAGKKEIKKLLSKAK